MATTAEEQRAMTSIQYIVVMDSSIFGTFSLKLRYLKVKIDRQNVPGSIPN
jgi:hypothetical protein